MKVKIVKDFTDLNDSSAKRLNKTKMMWTRKIGVIKETTTTKTTILMMISTTNIVAKMMMMALMTSSYTTKKSMIFSSQVTSLTIILNRKTKKS